MPTPSNTPRSRDSREPVCRSRAFQCVALAACIVAAGCAGVPVSEAPVTVAASATSRGASTPRSVADRVPVAIHEFRSAVSDVGARGTTDMFISALVRSGQFRVVERARWAEGVGRERDRNVQAGDSATVPTRVRYVFEGAVTEAQSSATQRTAALRVAGVELGGSSNRDTLGIDVRMVDADSGDIVNVVTVRKSVVSDGAGISGLGNLIGAALTRKGRPTTFVPDLDLQQQRKESLDVALRAAIDQAVSELAGGLPR